MLRMLLSMMRVSLVALGLVAGLWVHAAMAVDITFTDIFNFRAHRSPNVAGLLVGDVNVIGANSITPSGPGTTVQATQGGITYDLTLHPYTIFPDLYAVVPSPLFNPTLTGPWMLTAIDATGSISAFTNAIPTPKLIPLVTGITIGGDPLMPTLGWTLPDLTGFDVNRVSVRVRDLDNRVVASQVADLIFSSTNLGIGATSYTLPAGILEYGGHYSFEVLMENFQTGSSGELTFLLNRSETFSDPFAPTPEPATVLLLGATLLGLGAAIWKRPGDRTPVAA